MAYVPWQQLLPRLSLHLTIAWVSILTLPPIHCMPPASPIHCNATACTLSNSYGIWGDRKDCNISPQIIYPKVEDDIISAIASASKSKLTVKVVSKYSHTIPKLACPGTASGKSMIISTENYNSAIEINSEKMLVTVDSGVGLRELIDTVSEAGLSLVASPYWEGVSVGGMISTGAHGSSWWGKGGAVHDHVVGISLVVPGTKQEGYAKVIRLKGDDLLLNAAKLSLGLLGVISKVTLALEKEFKRSIRYNFTADDNNIENEFIEHGKKHEFGDITWYPSRHTAVYRYDDRVAISTPGDGVNDFIGFQSNLILVSKSDRAAEKALENARNVNGKCALASTFVGYKKLTANGLKNNILFTGYPVIGHQHKMQTSGSCLYSSPSRIDISCAWDPRINGLFFYETTAIFTIPKFRSFLLDVKKLRDLKPENFCGVDMYNGFLIRFIKDSSALLGQSEDSVVVDFNYYRADDAMSPRLNQDFLEEVEQMAFIKYDAKPHWAKNRAVAFLDVKRKYTKFNMFIAAKQKLDPFNMFFSEWSDAVLLGREGEKLDGCALEGQCICSEDRHCSPQNGYVCRAGLVYKEASVCRYSASLVA